MSSNSSILQHGHSSLPYALLGTGSCIGQKLFCLCAPSSSIYQYPKTPSPSLLPLSSLSLFNPPYPSHLAPKNHHHHHHYPLTLQSPLLKVTSRLPDPDPAICWAPFSNAITYHHLLSYMSHACRFEKIGIWLTHAQLKLGGEGRVCSFPDPDPRIPGPQSQSQSQSLSQSPGV